jgi:hypothetical protein
VRFHVERQAQHEDERSSATERWSSPVVPAVEGHTPSSSSTGERNLDCTFDVASISAEQSDSESLLRNSLEPVPLCADSELEAMKSKLKAANSTPNIVTALLQSPELHERFSSPVAAARPIYSQHDSGNRDYNVSLSLASAPRVTVTPASKAPPVGQRLQHNLDTDDGLRAFLDTLGDDGRQYTKMLSVGIHRDAVLHKMRKDGVSIDTVNAVPQPTPALVSHSTTYPPSLSQASPGHHQHTLDTDDGLRAFLDTLGDDGRQYTKMLSVGIHRDAVLHKMRKDGVCGQTVGTSSENTMLRLPSPPGSLQPSSQAVVSDPRQALQSALQSRIDTGSNR